MCSKYYRGLKKIRNNSFNLKNMSVVLPAANSNLITELCKSRRDRNMLFTISDNGRGMTIFVDQHDKLTSEQIGRTYSIAGKETRSWERD